MTAPRSTATRRHRPATAAARRRSAPLVLYRRGGPQAPQVRAAGTEGQQPAPRPRGVPCVPGVPGIPAWLTFLTSLTSPASLASHYPRGLTSPLHSRPDVPNIPASPVPLASLASPRTASRGSAASSAAAAQHGTSSSTSSSCRTTRGSLGSPEPGPPCGPTTMTAAPGAPPPAPPRAGFRRRPPARVSSAPPSRATAPASTIRPNGTGAISRRWRTSGGRAAGSSGRRCRARPACPTSPTARRRRPPRRWRRRAAARAGRSPPGEQAVAHLSVGGEPGPVAGAAERPGHASDHADRGRAAVDEERSPPGAGAAPRSVVGRQRELRRSWARISSAVTMFSRRQACWASSGICSMNRSSYPCSRRTAAGRGPRRR